jgi:hypothetical protein
MCVREKNGTSGNGDRYHGTAWKKEPRWPAAIPATPTATMYSARLTT